MRVLLFLLIVGLAVLSSCLSPSVIATQSIQKGDALNNQRNYKEALVAYHDFLGANSQLGIQRNLQREAEVHRKIGYIHSLSNQYDSSLIHYQTALEIDREVEENGTAALTDRNLIAITKAYQGQYRSALADFEEIYSSDDIQNNQKETDRTNKADVLFSMARLYYVLGSYQECFQRLEEAIVIYEKIESAKYQLAEAYYLRAMFLKDLGNFSASRAWLEKSIELAQSLDINSAKQLHLEGDLFFLENDYETGLQRHLEGLTNSEDSKIIPLEIQSLIEVGDAYDFVGDENTAREYYDRAIRLESSGSFEGAMLLRSGDLRGAQQYYATSGQLSGAAEASIKIADKFLLEEQYDSAERHLQLALSLFNQSNSQAGQTRVHLELAKVQIESGTVSNARSELSLARANPQFLENQWQLDQYAGNIFHVEGNYDSAKHYYTQAIRQLEEIRSGFNIHELKTSFLGTKNAVYEDLLDLMVEEYFRTNDEQILVEGFQWNERARSRAFLDLIGAKTIQPKNEDHLQLLQQEQQLRLTISRVSRELKEIQDSRRVDLLNTLQNSIVDYKKVTGLLQEADSAYASLLSIQPIDLATLQSNLTTEEMIVQYWHGSEFTYVWLIEDDKIRLRRLDVPEEELDRYFRYFRNTLGFPEDNRKASIQLRKLLIAPIWSDISTVEKLIIVPHRQSNFLPFQAFYSEEEGYLVSSHHISYAPSSSVFQYCRTQVPDPSNVMLSVALGKESINGFDPLPATEEEVRELGTLFSEKSDAIGVEATESFVKNNSKSANLVHIATHGVLSSRNPLRSYLLLNKDDKNDGLLTVSEIFDLDLKSKFVTLSACETALGEINRGNDLVGLSRAFIYSGSKAVIVSLWKVDDVATSELMKSFYRHLKSGEPLSIAMTLAQREMIQNNRTNEARLWSPFIIIGNGAVF